MSLKLIKYKKSDLKSHLNLLLMNNVYSEIDEKTKNSEKEWMEKF